jgi:UDP-N-acetylmuramoylalanine--D-glutamate ligase
LHNQENALAAAAAALVFGARPEAVTRALTEFTGLDHRMELVTEFGGVAFINSSMTTNVDSAIRVLETVGRPVILIAGGAPKNEDLMPLGPAIARYVSHAVLIGRAAPLIEAVAWAAGFNDVSRADSMADAVRRAVRRARPGDAVVLAPACASQDMFRDFEDRGRQFREAVRQCEADGGAGPEDDP